MAASTVQPSSKRPTTGSQMGFQSPLYWLSLATCPSCFPPIELTIRATELRRSKNVSNANAIMSLPFHVELLSRRISVPTMFISASQARAAT